MKQKKIYVFEINNRQSDYVTCLQFIEILENYVMNKKEKMDKLLNLCNMINVYVGESEKNSGDKYLEMPLKKIVHKMNNLTKENKEEIKEISFEKERLRKDNLELYLNHEELVQYHLRINMYDIEAEAGKDLVDLQYLALFLKKLEFDGFFDHEDRKVSVFIIPNTNNDYPFEDQEGNVDYETYKVVSQYLRLLSKRYTGIIYGVTKSKGELDIKALDFKIGKRYETYYPLLIIDNDKYEKLLDTKIQDNFFDGFENQINKSWGSSTHKNPEKGICDLIIETAEKKLIRELETTDIEDFTEKKDKLKFIHKYIKENQYCTPLHFSLFSFMFNLNGLYSKQDVLFYVENIWKLSEELCKGLRQVVQNSIQYSQTKECFLSFYEYTKSDKNIALINDKYPNTDLRGSKGHLKALEVFISDINTQKDMLDTFRENLKRECNLYSDFQNNGSRLLLEGFDKICIRNFFSVYEKNDLKKEWVEFRRQDVVAHMGLSLFSITAQKCKASLKVISDKNMKLKQDTNCFYKVYSDNENYELQLNDNDKIIPGTQFSILIPIQEWSETEKGGLGQLKAHTSVREGYESFAKYIDYKEKRTIIKPKPEKIHEKMPVSNNLKLINNADKKFEILTQWNNYWNKKINIEIDFLKKQGQEFVINFDFNLVNNDVFLNKSDNIELLFKGLISAFTKIEKYENKIYIALTNLPDDSIAIFRKISLLLSVRKFPCNLQLCLCECNCEDMIIMIGDDFTDAVYNSYILSIEHGLKSYSKDDFILSKTLKGFLCPLEINEKFENRDVMPFDAVLTVDEMDSQSIFEKRISIMAERPLDEDISGYKLNNTHMRLGNKVHINAFYEMSFLFYRTTIANRIAFIILRHLNTFKDKDFDILRSAIIFYGYASYSKAVLTSLTEILKTYRKNKIKKNSKSYSDKVTFVSYQHNLQSESEEIQLYYGLSEKEFPGIVDTDKRLELKEKTKIIQVVPISSTLTTFNKMWNKLKMSIKNTENTTIISNYTIFWIADMEGKNLGNMPTDKEKRYWSEIKKGQNIVTKFEKLREAGNNEVHFFIRTFVGWDVPLKCPQCFPENVVEEVPLVETDPTSTVPAQQIRYRKSKLHKRKINDKNNERLLELKNCVYYGHFSRRQNHYQYYIDTQQYFYDVKDKVKKWLEEENKQSDQENVLLNIIFSPEHNTNVGFAQYVNTYCFGGLAEVVSLNVDKQFRSNFKCEHTALMKVMEELHRDIYKENLTEDMLPVKFFFVDDTIISGETFEKANGFLHSLIPDEFKKLYPTNIFSKIFLLIDRLSDETKNMYVSDINNNFISYVHINISNMRTKGDSCVGCKLEQSARHMIKRSATQSLSNYWKGKKIKYHPIPYDNANELTKINKTDSFQKLLIGHVLQTIIFDYGNSFELGMVYDILLDICLWMLLDEKGENCQEEKIRNKEYSKEFLELLKDEKGVTAVQQVLQLISRPFFSYDFKVRNQVLTFLIILTENFLGTKIESMIIKDEKLKGFLKQNERISKTYNLMERIKKNLKGDKKLEIKFLQKYLFEGLTDLQSTYLMRKQTICKAYMYINDLNNLQNDVKQEFWKRYSINISKLTGDNVNESKALWLEYLFLMGHEGQEFEQLEKKKCTHVFLFNSITKEVLEKNGELKGQSLIYSGNENNYFLKFCYEIFLQNSSIYFDGLERIVDTNSEEDIVEDYFMYYWRKVRNLEQFILSDKTNVKNYHKESELFKHLKGHEDFLDSNEMANTVGKWYEKLLQQFVDVISEKYDIDMNEINIALLTKNNDDKSGVDELQTLDIVKEQINSGGISDTRYEIKNRIINALKNEQKGKLDLSDSGYYVNDCVQDNNRPYIIVLFDDKFKGNKLSVIKKQNKIKNVFLYVSIAKKQGVTISIDILLNLILRYILMYRNRILFFLKRDFSSEIFQQYARTIGEKNILSHEKAKSHAATADDEITMEMFVNPQILHKNYKKLTVSENEENDIARWLLLRNYTNGQIAKIFNKIFQEIDEKEQSNLYVKSDKTIGKEQLFNKMLDKFSKLNLEGDGRFRLLRSIMKIDVEDLNEAEFICNEKGEYYNLEYFKCILIDICLSAIKFKSDQEDFPLRVEKLLQKCNSINNEDNIQENFCNIKMFREVSIDHEIDYLVIQNPVNKLMHNLVNWEGENEIIERRLRDPLDYIDGHMSLLTTQKYIENLCKGMNLHCCFRYFEDKDEELLFETKLPVLKKERE